MRSGKQRRTELPSSAVASKLALEVEQLQSKMTSLDRTVHLQAKEQRGELCELRGRVRAVQAHIDCTAGQVEGLEHKEKVK